VNFEAPYYQDNKIGNLMKGYFVAPKTTRYRFRMACDDQCWLHMGLNTSDPTTMTQLLEITTATSHRKYYSSYDGTQYVSAWYDLVEGQQYLIEGRHIERTWSDHFLVSVEVEQTAVVNHPHAMKEIQYVEVKADTTFEMSQIIINNVGAGTFKMVFMHPTTLELIVTDADIPVAATAADLYAGIQSYFYDTVESDITVTRDMYDAANVLTYDTSLCYRSVYNITLRRLINGQSMLNMFSIP
jgi:hypothetical protein